MEHLEHTIVPLDEAQQTFLGEELVQLAREAYEIAQASELETSSRNTYTSYQRNYLAFCSKHHVPPLAVGSVLAYIAWCLRLGYAASAMQGRISAIGRLARESKQPDPTKDPKVRETLRGAVRLTRTGRKADGVLPEITARIVRRVEPLTYELLQRTIDVIDTCKLPSYRANERLRLRDRALVLFCHALGRRGAEIADLTMDDITIVNEEPQGWLIRFRWSKTNKSGEPEYVGIPSFPGNPLDVIGAMNAHFAANAIQVGSLFRTTGFVKRKNGSFGGGQPMTRPDIARRIEKIAEAAGLLGRWRSHSFKRGLVTDAEELGVARSRTNINTGWRSDAMYPRYADHKRKIAQSPLWEIYGKRPPGQLALKATDP